jgi:hypothetical protein
VYLEAVTALELIDTDEAREIAQEWRAKIAHERARRRAIWDKQMGSDSES